MPNIYIKDAGAWRNAQNLYVKDAGTWRLIKTGYTKVGGVWQKIWGNTGTITYTAGTATAFTVPAAVYSVSFTIVGGGGGSGGGDGGYGSYGGNSGQYITVTYAVTPGQVFNIYPGSGGGGGLGGVTGTGKGSGGINTLGAPYNGGTGGNAGTSGSSGAGGGGGAASVLTTGAGSVIAVAYGGSGAGGSGSGGGNGLAYAANSYRPTGINGDNHPSDGGGGGGGGGGVTSGLGGPSNGFVQSSYNSGTINGIGAGTTYTYYGSDSGGCYGQNGTGLVPVGAISGAIGNGGGSYAAGGNGYITVSY